MIGGRTGGQVGGQRDRWAERGSSSRAGADSKGKRSTDRLQSCCPPLQLPYVQSRASCCPNGTGLLLTFAAARYASQHVHSLHTKRPALIRMIPDEAFYRTVCTSQCKNALCELRTGH